MQKQKSLNKVWPRPIPAASHPLAKPRRGIRRGIGANFVVDESAPPTHASRCGFNPAVRRGGDGGVLRSYNKLGLIGLGYFGKNYLRLLQNINGATLCAVANRETAPFETYKNSLVGIKTTANAEEIFSDPEIDAVFIVTPPKTHFDLIESGLKAGKHIFVEKPMVLNIAEAEKLKKIVEQSGKIFMVGYQYLFNENIRFIKKEITNGTFGKIISFKSEYAVSPSRSDIDIFWDAGPHPLSVFQYLFSPTKLVSAEGELRKDKASVQIKFSNQDGAGSGKEKSPSLEILTSRLGELKTRKFTITGEKATAILDETLEKNKLTILKNGQISYPEIISKEPLQSEIEHFIKCIQTGETPLTNIDFGSQITKWLETISERLGKK